MRDSSKTATTQRMPEAEAHLSIHASINANAVTLIGNDYIHAYNGKL
jgi:hypothetical protein